MAAKVTPMNTKMLIATLPGEANIAEWCRKLGISRESAYKWRRRFAEEGPAGLEERSRAPKQTHAKTDSLVEDLVVRIRKELNDQGLGHGPASVADRLRIDHDIELTDSTVWRILSRRGQINVQPKKRPRSSWKSWTRSRPNELWQGDDTHYFLASGCEVKIINMVDDHSRLNVESRAATNCTSEAILETFCIAAARHGVPAEFLNDNGRAWISHREFGSVAFQANLLRIGVRQIHSSPYHPQTCGKTERFHQTQCQWLDARPAAETIDELQQLLDEFRITYNERRPHRGIGRKTPMSVWKAQPPAAPPTEALEGPMTIALCWVSRGQIRPASKIRIGLGAEWTGCAMAVIRKGDHLSVISIDTGEIVREVTLEPIRSSYGTGKARGGRLQQRHKPKKM